MMSSKPTFLFLHGVGTGDPEGEWQERLSETLRRLGYPGLDSARVIAPRYAHLLRGADDPEPLPPIVGKQPTGDAAKSNRRDFERRIGAIEFRLGTQDPGKGMPGSAVLLDFALGIPFFEQARNYLNDPAVRAQVLNKILGKLPESGSVVIVGHSLGSVIAADVLRRLPSGIHVVGMVTVGSPLASASFGVDKLRETLREPPPNLAWWVSFWHGRDPVAARRGVSSVFPWMIDFRARGEPLNPHAAHQAVEYFSQDVVAEAVGFALFGSRSRDLAAAERVVDVPLDTAEIFALTALRYGHLILQRLEGDLHDRFGGALRRVQADVVQLLRAQRVDAGKSIPADVADIGFDLADPHADVPAPRPSRHLAKDEAVIPLTVMMAQNVIRPYEISVSLETRMKAMEDLTAEMGLGSPFGRDVFAAAKEAQLKLGGGRGVNWVRWGALGAGAAALVVATGGLALAAGAGLVGAAAITSALAAFGPGGMIGGLLTAGTLVTAGGGGVAFGLASQGTPAEAVEAVVSGQLTAEILRLRHGLPSDPTVWRNLVDMEMTLRREHERLDEFSDPSAPSVKQLERKIDIVERALAYLESIGLEPGESEGSAHPHAGSPSQPWYRRVVPTPGKAAR
jgi:pimeloyl-ACP methyl ester carboxylesterase